MMSTQLSRHLSPRILVEITKTPGKLYQIIGTLLQEMVEEVLPRPLVCCLPDYQCKLSPGRIAEIQFSD